MHVKSAFQKAHIKACNFSKYTKKKHVQKKLISLYNGQKV